jgi:hypothetical protein
MHVVDSVVQNPNLSTSARRVFHKYFTANVVDDPARRALSWVTVVNGAAAQSLEMLHVAIIM